MPDQRPAQPAADNGFIDVRRLRGRVSAREVEVANNVVAEILARSHTDASDVRARLTGAKCEGGPGLVQVNLVVNGTPARVQASGRSMERAVVTAGLRLELQLRRLSGTQEQVLARDLAVWPDPQRRQLALGVPGRITRLKSVPLARTTPAVACATMAAMDYDAHLFVDETCGEDAIVFRGGPTGLRLARQHTLRPPLIQPAPTIVVHVQRPPTMRPDEAANWLASHRLPHLFFTDIDSGRGSLLYRRYDAHLTLLTGSPR